jgi:hypothetical protein
LCVFTERSRSRSRPELPFLADDSSTPAMATTEVGLSNSSVSRLRCVRQHGYRRFWNRQQRSRHLPPLLWTFPGAGNTWIRGLLDFSTGIYTGSIYGDPSLLPLLPGEGRCDRSIIALKAHPQHIDSFDFIRAASDSVLRLNITRKPQYAKCAPYRFRSAIAVVRDPYRSIWAEYKRHVNWREVVTGKSSGEVSKTNRACRLAMRRQSLHSGALLRACFDPGHFSSFATRLARQWKHMWFHYGRFQRMQGARLHVVSFEQLLSPARRADVLRGMIEFTLGSNVAQQKLVADATSLACAFHLADSPHIHRDHSKPGGALVTIGDAYANSSLVCAMWKLFRRKATQAGYAPFGRARCGAAT